MKYIKFKEKYVVSDFGDVWAITRNGLVKREPKADSHGYLRTSIHGKQVYIHRIVIEAFKGKSELTVDHLNMNILDNKLDNLEYVTQSENTRRMNKHYRKDITKMATISHSKKVKWNGNVYDSARELSRHLGLNVGTVGNAIRKGHKTKGHYATYL